MDEVLVPEPVPDHRQGDAEAELRDLQVLSTSIVTCRALRAEAVVVIAQPYEAQPESEREAEAETGIEIGVRREIADMLVTMIRLVVGAGHAAAGETEVAIEREPRIGAEVEVPM